MCGITGFFSPQSTWQEIHLQEMTKRLAHRGPDAYGYFMENGCGLGHRRLSILDLSEEGKQPMLSQDQAWAMVFNGEIYNYQELKEKLPQVTQQKLRGHSDTEVILELLAQKGIGAVADFNGMFSIALYHRPTQHTWLLRDRIGIKPLYYYYKNQSLAFASELKALLALPIAREIYRPAIAQYLHLGYVPAPYSIYQDIYKLPAGSYLQMDAQGAIEIQQYWSLEDKIPTKPIYTEEGSAKAQLKALLQSAVGYRLIADVPLGVLLSGGVDSSLVAALAAEQAGSQKMKTFSMGFEEARFNEAPYAQEVAARLGTEHYALQVSMADAQSLVPQMTAIYDEPYADSSAIPTLLVSALARQKVTVALGGDGGDELFLGYGMYQWASRLQAWPLRYGRKPLAALLELLPERRLQKAAAMLDYPGAEKLPAHIFSQEQQFFSEKMLQKLLLRPYQQADFFRPALAHYGSAAFGQSVFDMRYYLPDDLLVKVDRASMRHGLELRVPLLDYRVVEFALQLHPDLKYKQGQRKYLLRQVLADYLPLSLFERPKQGFAIPLAQWLKGALRDWMESYLHESILKKHGVVAVEVVAQLKKAYLSGQEAHYNRLWALTLLHQFLEEG